MIKDKDVKIETKDIKNLTPSITGGVFLYRIIFLIIFIFMVYEVHYYRIPISIIN
jgi:hypothetical protein